jgi:zinc protease
VDATVRPGADPREVEQELDRVVTDLVREGPTVDELQRAQSRMLARDLRAAERLGGSGGRSDILARGAIYDGRSDSYLDRLERLATTTPATVSDASRRWLDAPHYTLTVDPVP